MQEHKRKGQPKGQKLPKGQNSEGTYSKGTKKKGEEKNSSSTQAKSGEERKVLWKLKRTFGVWNCEEWGLYL